MKQPERSSLSLSSPSQGASQGALHKRIQIALKPLGLRLHHRGSQYRFFSNGVENRGLHRTLYPYIVIQKNPYTSSRSWVGSTIVGEYSTLKDVARHYGVGLERRFGGSPRAVSDIEIVAVLSQPHTCTELTEVLGVSEKTIRHAVHRLRMASLVTRVAGDGVKRAYQYMRTDLISQEHAP